MNLWKDYTLAPGKTYHWSIGPLELWLEHDDSEWRAYSECSSDELACCADEKEKPDEKEWTRWAVSSKSDTIRLTPVLPDRPLIARPHQPITILQGNEAAFFVSVPLWIRATLVQGNDKELVLNEWPPLQLSSSWSGTPVEGELCYALKTRARRLLEEIEFKPFRAICPVTIKNEADVPLKFERVCLHGSCLNVYQGSTHMWTGRGKVTYKGPVAISQLTFLPGPPPFDNAVKIIGNAREEARSFVARSFDNLRSYGIGF